VCGKRQPSPTGFPSIFDFAGNKSDARKFIKWDGCNRHIKLNIHFGGIVKRTFSAVMFFALAVAALQGMPVHAQTGAGTIFKVVPTPNGNQFNSSIFAASASSANDIWAVGDSTMHFNGAKWTAFPAPLINGDLTANLQGVVDISPTLAWTVGNVTLGANPGQIIERWNGTKWSLLPNPAFPPNSQADLFAITSTSANDIWAVGNLVQQVVGGALSFNLFEHWDGKAWTPTLTNDNTFEALTGVSADATNDAWAVGWVAPLTTGSNEPLAIHWNGANWVSAVTPHAGEGANELNAVLALAPNDAWAVGFSTPDAPPQQSATLTLIEHFDGTSWTVVPSPNVGPNSTSQSNR
jgi:hypothetical protein